jgi:hypothetical protein
VSIGCKSPHCTNSAGTKGKQLLTQKQSATVWCKSPRGSQCLLGVKVPTAQTLQEQRTSSCLHTAPTVLLLGCCRDRCPKLNYTPAKRCPLQLVMFLTRLSLRTAAGRARKGRAPSAGGSDVFDNAARRMPSPQTHLAQTRTRLKHLVRRAWLELADTRDGGAAREHCKPRVFVTRNNFRAARDINTATATVTRAS